MYIDAAGLLYSALKKPSHNPTSRRYTDGNIPKRVHFPSAGESTTQLRLRGPKAALETSLSVSRSLYNSRMSVTQSGLGLSVKPMNKKITKEGIAGHKILTLDGGGIKVKRKCTKQVNFNLPLLLLLLLFCLFVC